MINSEKIEIEKIINDIFISCKRIYNLISNYSSNLVQTKNSLNPTGDKSLDIDIFAQNEIVNNLKNNIQIAAIVSEEELNPIILNKKGKYILAMDPLDGSSNIETNGPSGTIFSLYKRISNENEDLNDNDFLQKGINQLAAGYSLYSAFFTFVYAKKNDTLKICKWNKINDDLEIITQDHKIPLSYKYYSINEAYSNLYDSEIRDLLEKLKEEKLSSRYSGALVAEVHRILISGGIFLYPKTKSRPEGKLRLMFESNPIAFLLNIAGGLTIDGIKNILDIKPEKIHQTTPLYLGNLNLLTKYFRTKITIKTN